MRGKGKSAYRRKPRAGITPAHAGKRQSQYPRQSKSWDHPRPCGEKYAPAWLNMLLLGSPPPMRGKEPARVLHRDKVRITPAHAGKSVWSSCSRTASGDHPRPCGEKTYHPHVHALLLGSPPPMRGKVILDRHYKRRIRITPAHAGKSRCCAQCWYVPQTTDNQKGWCKYYAANTRSNSTGVW